MSAYLCEELKGGIESHLYDIIIIFNIRPWIESCLLNQKDQYRRHRMNASMPLQI